MGPISAWAIRRPVIALLTWLVAVVVVGLFAVTLDGKFNDSFSLPNTQSALAQDFRIGFVNTDRIFREASLAKAAQAYAHGSPTSAALSYELMKRHANADLADVLRLEYQASLGCCAHPDFPEGVRALLVDKDKLPRWTPAHLREVEAELIADILTPRFKDSHPLADLGKA